MSDVPTGELESEFSGGTTQVCSSILLQNSFGILQQQDYNEADNETNETQQQTPIKPGRCPPINVCKTSVQEINKLLHELNGDGKFVLRCSNGVVQIRMKCRTLFASVQEALKQLNAEFYTHATRDESMVKIVLSGLPLYSLEELKAELAKNNIIPREVKLLSKSRDNSDALYVLHFDKGTVKLNKLREVKYLFNVVVFWRHWTRRISEVLQCFRCQRFGHGSRHCNMKTRCVKCGKPHASKDCTIPKKAQNHATSTTHKGIKCANCGQNHAASFKECPCRLDFIKRQQKSASRPKANANQTTNSPRKFTSNWVSQNRSFAETVSGQSSSDLTAEGNYATRGINDHLFTLSEFLSLARDMFNRFKACTSKEEQFFALQELMAKYLNIR